MELNIKILCVLLFFLAVGSFAYAKEGPRISALGEPWQFGNVKKGDTKERVFRIKNVGDADLIIKKVHSCCGYSVVEVSSWQIEPDDIVRLKIQSDTSRKSPGEDKKKITIISNDTDNHTLKISVFSNVVEKVSKRRFWGPPS